MSSLLKLSAIFICLFVISPSFYSCTFSHSGKVKKDLDKSSIHYVGKSKDELLINKGAPDFKEELSNGDILWTYRNSKTGKYRGVTVSTGDAPSRRSIVTWVEITNFIIDQNGYIIEVITAVE